MAEFSATGPSAATGPAAPPPAFGNLLAALPAFVGRDGELARLGELVARERLVTVTGVGGVGKTRTAIETAVRAVAGGGVSGGVDGGVSGGPFPDGVWLIRLAQLRDSSLLPHFVCREMRLQDQTTRPMVEVLTDRLRDVRCLLIFDGCEHLLESCALLLTVLLDAAPGLSVLATSRQPLDLSGEARFALEPMAAAGDAASLFAERARRVRPGFALDDANRPAVERLCARLDGIPLAVELAAALVADAEVEQLAEQLEDRFRLAGPPPGSSLSSSPGSPPARPGGPAHHATLWTAIGWSHGLCTPKERLLWARLSVFAGGFSAAAARAVGAGGPLAAAETGPTLAALVDKSVVTEREGRYSLLDTISEFGAFWLRELGEEGDSRLRHRDHYLDEAHAAFEEWFAPAQADWARRFVQDYADLRLALETCFAEPGGAALDLLGSLWFFWYCCGHQREGRLYFERALERDTAPGYERMRAAWAYGLIVIAQGDTEATERAIGVCRAAAVGADAAPDGVAARATAYLDGTSRSIRGEVDRALETVAAFDVPIKATGMLEATSLMIQACVSYVQIVRGDYTEALRIGQWIQAEGARRGEFKYRSWGEYIWALADLAVGDAAGAAEHARLAFEANRRLSDYWGMALVLDALALASAALGSHGEAARALGAGEQAWRSTYGTSQFGSPELAAARQACERQIRAAVGDEAYEAHFAVGYATPLVEIET
jgi:predicted ATPase